MLKLQPSVLARTAQHPAHTPQHKHLATHAAAHVATPTHVRRRLQNRERLRSDGARVARKFDGYPTHCAVGARIAVLDRHRHTVCDRCPLLRESDPMSKGFTRTVVVACMRTGKTGLDMVRARDMICGCEAPRTSSTRSRSRSCLAVWQWTGSQQRCNPYR